MKKILKWHIYRANLDPVIGSEQGKSRPVFDALRFQFGM
ncbi:MAG: hypothetical protein RLZZ292_2151 [Bacteroidota bacterium]|jgi:hypothetical protein